MVTPTPATVEMVPVEIIDDILQYLHDHTWKTPFRRNYEVKPSLRACSLVCKGWRTLAQAHLFHDVLYSFTEDDDDGGRPTVEIPGSRWIAYEDVDYIRPRKTLEMLHGFLTSSPRLASSIRRLVLDAHAHANPRQHWMYTSEQGVHFSALYDLMRTMPQLQELSTRNVIVLPSPDLIPPPSRPSLRRLHVIYDAILRQPVDIPCILDCFHSVENFHLTFSGLEPIGAGRPVDSIVTNVFMDAYEGRIPVLIEALLQCLRRDAVRRVTASSTSVWLYQPLIDTVAPTLETLTYEFPRHPMRAYDSTTVRPYFRGTPFPKLRALCVTLTVPATRAEALAEHVATVAAFLEDASIARATHPALEELGLHVRFVAEEGQPCVDTAVRRHSAQSLDRVLVAMVHEFALQTVVVRWLLDEGALRKDREVWVREMLPTLQEQGMLEFRGVIGGVPPGLMGRIISPFEAFVEYIS